MWHKMMGEGENAGEQHFLLFPTKFLVTIPGLLKPGLIGNGSFLPENEMLVLSDLKSFLELKETDKCNTILSAYTSQRHLEKYCSHLS